MIKKHKLKGIGTKKNEVFEFLEEVAIQVKLIFLDHFFETIKIRLDNKQNKILVLIIFIAKFIKNLGKL